MNNSPFKLPPLPEPLEIQRPVVTSAPETMEALKGLVRQSVHDVDVITVSGLCGGCKSTLSREIETREADHLVPVTLNGLTQKVLSLDWVMSVSRGPQKLELLENATPDSIRADFFRTRALADLITSIRNRDGFELTDAYDAEDDGRLTGKLIMPSNTDKSILVAEGTVAHAATEIALASTAEETSDRTAAAINLLVYTDPAVALLNTVKRGVIEPSRKKDPHYAFREFLSFNSLLLPGYVNFDQHSAELVYRPDDINPLMFQALIEFFSTPGYESLPKEFIAIVHLEFQTSDALLDAQNKHIIEVLETINDAITDRA